MKPVTKQFAWTLLIFSLGLVCMGQRSFANHLPSWNSNAPVGNLILLEGLKMK